MENRITESQNHIDLTSTRNNDAIDFTHLFKRINENEFELTGACKRLQDGDIVKIPQVAKNETMKTNIFKVIQITERRNHRGIWKNKEDGINAFFKAIIAPIFETPITSNPLVE